jgi:hypothetical protein
VKVEIKSDGTDGGTHVVIDGAELKNVEHVSFVHRAGKPPRVIVSLWVDDLDLAGDVELRATTRVIEST